MSGYKKAYDALWRHLMHEHGCLTVNSEMDEIIRLSVAVEEARKAEEAMHAASEVIQDSKKPTQ